MPISHESEDSRSIEAGGFRLVFRWLGHAWTHWVEDLGRSHGSPRVLALALEGDPDRDDPSRVVSPAYQQLHLQDDGPAIRALLVGQSGPHHFSAVFALEERPTGEVRIDVDVADRCRGPVELLASTYTVDARSDDLGEATPSLARWDFRPGRLSFAAASPARVVLAEAGRRATQIQALAGPGPGAATRRFAYSWHWQPGPDR